MSCPAEAPSAAIERLRAEREASSLQSGKSPRKLPLSAIHVEPLAFQVRSDGLDVERVKEIAGGLDGSNLDETVHVWWSGKRWIVIDGHHRHAAYSLKQEQSGKTLAVPVVAHTDISLGDAIGMAGRLNNREKVKISKAEMLNNAWRMVCLGEGSIKQQSECSGVGKSTISNMRQAKEFLATWDMTPSSMIDAGWEQCRTYWKGKSQRDHGPDALELMAQSLAKELAELKVTSILKSPDVLARALEIMSPALLSRLLESEPFWTALNVTGRAILEEADAEEVEEGGLSFEGVEDF
jgi:hypothetical protein